MIPERVTYKEIARGDYAVLVGGQHIGWVWRCPTYPSRWLCSSGICPEPVRTRKEATNLLLALEGHADKSF